MGPQDGVGRPLLHLLTHGVGVEADGEDGRCTEERGPHPCNVVRLSTVKSRAAHQSNDQLYVYLPSTATLLTCRKTLTLLSENEKNLNVLLEMRQSDCLV